MEIISLRDNLEKCNKLLSDVSILKGQSDAKDENVKNNNRFFDAFNKFLITVESYSYLKSFEGFSFSSEFINQLNECKKVVVENFANKTVTKPIVFSNSVNQLYSKGELEWKTYISEKNHDLIEQLSIFNLVSNNKTEVNEIIKALNNIEIWPINSANFTRYNNRKKQALNKIEEIHFDEEIENFLIKVKNRTATFLDVTTTVRDWIKNNNLDGNIFIVIKT